MWGPVSPHAIRWPQARTHHVESENWADKTLNTYPKTGKTSVKLTKENHSNEKGENTKPAPYLHHKVLLWDDGIDNNFTM